MGEWLDPLRSLIAIGLALLLVMLRLEAASFNAAEYHESVDGRTPSFRRRVAWYGLGIALIVGILFVHPTPRQDLLLGVGDRGKTIVYGFLYAAGGTGIALAVAWYRYRLIRFPDFW